jgi:ribonuclease HI
LTDSKYAHGLLQLNWNAKQNKELVADILAVMDELRVGHRIEVHWVAGHADIPGNERANQLAGDAMRNQKKLCSSDRKK